MSAPKNVEIERKFLIKSDAWRQQRIESSEDLRQGFLSVDPERTVRVRVRAGKGYLTIKGKTKVSMASGDEERVDGNMAACYRADVAV
jgi:adenylate cyclase